MSKLFKNKKNIFKYILSILSFVFFAFVLYKFYKMGILTDEEALSDFLGDWAFLAPVIFVLLRIIVSFVPFLPNMIFIIVGFAMFGGARGFLYNYLGSSLAALANFFMVKIFGTKVLTSTFPEEKIKKYKKRIDTSQKKFNRFLFIVSSVPLAPSNFFGMIAALTSITTKKYIEITMISKIPETLVIGIILKYFRDLLGAFL